MHPSNSTRRGFFRSLHTVLQQEEKITGVLQQAKILRKITAAVHQPMPHYMQPHCQAGAMDEQKIVLFAESPSWATQLRYLTPQLKQHLVQKGLMKIGQKLTIRVGSPQGTGTTGESRLPKPHKLSPYNAQLLQETAKALGSELDDASLQRVLLKLARHV